MSKAKKRKGFARAVLYNAGFTTAAQLATITIDDIADGYLYYRRAGTCYKASLTAGESASACHS